MLDPKPRTTKTFRKALKKCKKRGKDLSKLTKVLKLIIEQKPIAPKYKDHKLIGSLTESRDIHIEPDWILIYKILNNILILEYTGTHSDFFKK